MSELLELLIEPPPMNMIVRNHYSLKRCIYCYLRGLRTGTLTWDSLVEN